MEQTFQTARAQIKIARILVLLADGPLTTEQIAERLHLSKSGAAKYVCHLRERPNRRIYAHDWTPPTNGGGRAMIHALGSRRDACYESSYTPPKRAYVPKADRRVPLSTRVTHYLQDHPESTTQQVAAALGADLAVLTMALVRMKKDGRTLLKPAPDGKRGRFWSLPSNDWPGAPLRLVSRHWKAPAVKQQNPFSTLFAA